MEKYYGEIQLAVTVVVINKKQIRGPVVGQTCSDFGAIKYFAGQKTGLEGALIASQYEGILKLNNREV